MLNKHFIMNYYHIAYALVCLLLAQTCLAASVLHGVIKQNAADGMGMSGMLIRANGANQTRTDANGQFFLKFPKKQAGDEVSLRMRVKSETQTTKDGKPVTVSKRKPVVCPPRWISSGNCLLTNTENCYV